MPLPRARTALLRKSDSPRNELRVGGGELSLLVPNSVRVSLLFCQVNFCEFLFLRKLSPKISISLRMIARQCEKIIQNDMLY